MSKNFFPSFWQGLSTALESALVIHQYYGIVIKIVDFAISDLRLNPDAIFYSLIKFQLNSDLLSVFSSRKFSITWRKLFLIFCFSLLALCFKLLYFFVEANGVEPMTFCVQGRRSSQLS